MPSKQKWTVHDIPDLTGKTIIVTGANSGLGYETTCALASKHATIIMACRNPEKAKNAEEKIKQQIPGAKLSIMELDLASLHSIRNFTEKTKKQFRSLDLLINNAGIMLTPYGKTKDGFEMQFGINHLGHFALTGQLIGLLLATKKSRIITVSSGVHLLGRIDFNNLNAEKSYNKIGAYALSKLANLSFTFELHRLLTKTGTSTIAVAAHPGWAATNLQQHTGFFNFLNQFIAQGADMGSLPTLYAATAPGVKGGDFYGPDGFAGLKGYPKKTKAKKKAYDAVLAGKLWEVSGELTGVVYNL